MNVQFIEKKTTKVKTDEGKDIEREESELVEFETHECELANSVAFRYMKSKTKLEPPPGTTVLLTDGVRGTILKNRTMKELQQEGILTFGVTAASR